MEYKEKNCVICGAKIIDTTSNQIKIYCSRKCARKGRYINQKRIEENTDPSCVYNIAIRCTVHRCGVCGWNPKVAEKRLEAIAHG